MRPSRLLTFSLVSLIALCSCQEQEAENKNFITVADGHFVGRDATPIYFAGMNFWYGAILGSQGEGGDRERLIRELDMLKSIGADNLRILVGSDGLSGVPTKAEPTLQTAPGEYNDDILDGLDFLMAELGKRDMKAVLYLNNAWEWSGGYSQYLSWAEGTKAPVPAIDGWDTYMQYVKGYLRSERAKELFANHVKYIISRTNRYTGLPYTEDPAIFSWQIANEPRAFAQENKELLYEWIASVASLIKGLDGNHMVSVGSEGSWGCENDMELWGRILALDDIDYGNIHIWPFNWGWLRNEDGTEDPEKWVDRAIENTMAYIGEHLEVAGALAGGVGKPVTLEEFGFPRDGFGLAPGSPTTARDTYYKEVLAEMERQAENGGLLAGCNIWGWGGEARAVHEFWQPGDPYTGDPAQEAQGLNSVFVGDNAVELVRKTNEKIKSLF